jgi:hypothetical protein
LEQERPGHARVFLDAYERKLRQLVSTSACARRSLGEEDAM